MLSALQFVHSLKYVYRDMKPHNVMINLSDVDKNGNLNGNARLIDFGLAKRYICNNRHVSFKRKNFSGTLKYASINAHNRMTQSRRDDMESLFYTVLYLLKKSYLPWNEITVSSKKVRNEKIKNMKQNLDIYEVVSPHDNMYAKFGIHATTLGFFEKPCYDWCSEKISII